MKTKILPLFTIIVILTFLFNKVNGQSTTADNTLSGGSPPSAAEFLGSNNGYNVEFRANNTPYMTLTTAGNLGIGTTTPDYLLEINTGDLNLTDGIIRIGDDEMVIYDATANNLGYGTVHPFDSITSGGDNIFVGFNA